MDKPVEMFLQSTYLSLVKNKRIAPERGCEAAMSAAVTIGVTLCHYDDATMERLFRKWLADARALQNAPGTGRAKRLN